MLRSTFMGFEIAKRGLSTSQKGLDISGHNMTNWDSEGYTRQRVDQVAISPYSGAQRYSYNLVGKMGQGVHVPGIGQIRDSFLDKRFRDEHGETGYFGTVQTILSDIEGAIGEFNPLTNAGIRGSLETLLPALKNFSETPYSETAANIVQTEFKNLTQTLQQLNSKLEKTAEQHKFDLKISVSELGEKFQQLANLNYAIAQNKGIVRQNAGYGPNELLDRQNLLLDEIARYGDLDVQINDDLTVTVSMGGRTVVEGENYERMEYVDNGDGTVGLRWVSSGESIHLTTGSLKAYTDFINGRGPNQGSSNETHYKGILYYQDQLDTFARTLVSVVNQTIPEYDANGNPTGDYKMLLGGISDTMDASGHYPVRDDIVITAANISISDAWVANHAYVIARPDNKENNNILSLYTALNSTKISFNSRGETYTGTFYEFVDSYAGVLAEDYTFYNGRHESSSINLGELQDRRDSVSGVVMDEEVASMMLYNKSYQAASRLMTTLDEALDILINRTGRVGL
jgi:flagellar hook-associated protein 1 FlgK